MTLEYNMRGIPAASLPQFWHFAEPYIKRALDHTSGELSLGDIKRLCEQRDIQLWLVSHGSRVVGAATTEIVLYPRRKHCRVITLAGSSFSDWVDMAEGVISTWAVTEHCNAVESFVRKGMVPRMIPLGYKHKYSVIVKELPT